MSNLFQAGFCPGENGPGRVSWTKGRCWNASIIPPFPYFIFQLSVTTVALTFFFLSVLFYTNFENRGGNFSYLEVSDRLENLLWYWDCVVMDSRLTFCWASLKDSSKCLWTACSATLCFSSLSRSILASNSRSRFSCSRTSASLRSLQREITTQISIETNGFAFLFKHLWTKLSSYLRIDSFCEKSSKGDFFLNFLGWKNMDKGWNFKQGNGRMGDVSNFKINELSNGEPPNLWELMK